MDNEQLVSFYNALKERIQARAPDARVTLERGGFRLDRFGFPVLEFICSINWQGHTEVYCFTEEGWIILYG